MVKVNKLLNIPYPAGVSLNPGAVGLEMADQK
jgi:hypothetical protein